MTVAACYVMNVQCDGEAHRGGFTPRDQFTGTDRRAAVRKARACGWKFGPKSTVYCRECQWPPAAGVPVTFGVSTGSTNPLTPKDANQRFTAYEEPYGTKTCIPPRLRKPGESVGAYRVAMGWPVTPEQAREAVEEARNAALLRIRDGIAADRCDGESEWANGVNAACANHLKFIDAVLGDFGVNPSDGRQG